MTQRDGLEEAVQEQHDAVCNDARPLLPFKVHDAEVGKIGAKHPVLRVLAESAFDHVRKDGTGVWGCHLVDAGRDEEFLMGMRPQPRHRRRKLFQVVSALKLCELHAFPLF